MSARGSDCGRDGRLIIETFDAKTDVATAKLTGSYTPSSQDGGRQARARPARPVALLDPRRHGHGRPRPSRGRCSRAQGCASRRLAGHDRRSWRVDGVPEGLAKPTVKLSGGADLQRDQSWKLDAVRIASEALTLEMSGRGKERTGEIDLSLALPKLGLLQDGVGGSANTKGKIVLKADRRRLPVQRRPYRAEPRRHRLAQAVARARSRCRRRGRERQRQGHGRSRQPAADPRRPLRPQAGRQHPRARA